MQKDKRVSKEKSHARTSNAPLFLTKRSEYLILTQNNVIIITILNTIKSMQLCTFIMKICMYVMYLCVYRYYVRIIS